MVTLVLLINGPLRIGKSHGVVLVLSLFSEVIALHVHVLNSPTDTLKSALCRPTTYVVQRQIAIVKLGKFP